ncbi:MAG TPA: hypothetical protein VIH35_08930, partial [Kiritimatiellia bacterium]
FAEGVMKPIVVRPSLLRGGQAWAALLVLLLAVGAVRMVASYAFNRRADGERNRMQFDAALADYAMSVRCDGSNWSPCLGMAHLRQIQSFWSLDAEGKRTAAREAETLYQETLHRNPWETDAQFGMSKLYEGTGEKEKSLAVLEDLVARIPHQRAYLSELGLRLRQMGRYEDALKRFEEASRVENTEMIDINIRWLREKLGEAAP